MSPPPPAAPAFESAGSSAEPTPPPPPRESDAGDPHGWSREEVSAFHVVVALSRAQANAPRAMSLAQLATAAPGPAVAAALRRDGTVCFDGYCYRMTGTDERGRPTHGVDPATATRAFALYAWPRDGRGRAFCGYADGVLCTLHDGAYAGPDAGPSPDAALSPTALPTLRAGLVGPGRGRDGLRWAAVRAPGPETELRIRVLDADEKELQGYPVRIAPPSWFGEGAENPMAARRIHLPRARLPLGQARSAADGHIAIRGMEAPGLSLFTPQDSTEVQVRELGDAIVLVVRGQTGRDAQLRANEQRAIATLRAIAAAQARHRRERIRDADRDGRGEYGFLDELIRSAADLDAAGSVDPEASLLELGTATSGPLSHGGYVFAVWLPDRQGLPENRDAGDVDPDGAETGWIAYAWPERYGESGEKAYATSAQGDVLEANNQRTTYSGQGRAPEAAAAIPIPYADAPFEAPWQATQTGQDGNVWRLVR